MITKEKVIREFESHIQYANGRGVFDLQDIIESFADTFWEKFDVTYDDLCEFLESLRVCNATKKVMTEGYCFDDGEIYFADEKDALKHARSSGYKSLSQAYKDDVYYYSEWESTDLFD